MRRPWTETVPSEENQSDSIFRQSILRDAEGETVLEYEWERERQRNRAFRIDMRDKRLSSGKLLAVVAGGLLVFS